jgi:type II secretion system protein C
MLLIKKSFIFIISFVLLLLLAWQSAQFFWQVFAPPWQSSSMSRVTSSNTPAVIHIDLFGSAQAHSSAAVLTSAQVQALQTWLLFGTVLDGEHALALVQMGTMGLRWLKMGEQLDNGLQVVRILPNEVQLLTAQGIKSLLLFDKGNTVLAPQAVTSAPTPLAITQDLQAARAKLKQNPMSAMQLMRMNPIFNQGQLSGLTLTPQSGQEALFAQLGLQTGDVLVALNGEPVGAWMKKMADLPRVLDASGAKIKVLRAGAEKEWTVNW